MYDGGKYPSMSVNYYFFAMSSQCLRTAQSAVTLESSYESGVFFYMLTAVTVHKYFKRSITNIYLLKCNVDCRAPVWTVQENSVPEYPEYSTFLSRLKTFDSHPLHSYQDKYSLAERGFTYSGMGDLVQCFYCGLLLSEWEKNDEVWQQHAMHNPECVYCAQFIENCLTRYPVCGESKKVENHWYMAMLEDIRGDQELYRSQGLKMVRNYIKKTNRGTVSEDIYKNAAAEMLSKESSLRNAAEKYEINFMNLQRYIKKQSNLPAFMARDHPKFYMSILICLDIFIEILLGAIVLIIIVLNNYLLCTISECTGCRPVIATPLRARVLIAHTKNLPPGKLLFGGALAPTHPPPLPKSATNANLVSLLQISRRR
ncbi:death-associated inhibitor of apoptosis 1-like [Aphis craccivora]|uniref:Death-associated inhibitor of apoptosis 1-like n=1 Tax=Aphis craccivora TaxID=307492 RepID=A0A6G0YAQ4_APHCR|nr:death-associated inhibitor of apoptosis 1-like [Aphis craccivora]